jgi:hypothetical protein
MSGLTIAQVRSWRPAELATAATALSTARSDLETGITAARRALDETASSWTGQAAQAARERAATEAAQGRELSEALQSTRTALDSGATDIGTARTHLLSTISGAQAEGFRVDDAGNVTAPTLPPVMTAPGDPTGALDRRDAEQTRLNQEATAIAGQITSALQAVADADGRTADGLTSVEVPAGLEAEVRAYIERIMAGSDLVGALGATGAGGVTLTQAIIKGVGLFGRTSAYRNWLTMTGAQLRNTGGALRFMTGNGGSAAAYLDFVRATQGADDARALFQTGKPNGGFLRHIVGSGAARTIGKVFLPLTAATGLVDTVTGGGYDGARGWATRGFGLAGAAGAGTMMAMSAGLLASNPIGWGIAGAAVLGYGAWSLGNLIYDNREAIGEFIGNSAEWVGDRATDAWNATTGAVSDATDWAGDQLDSAGEAISDFADDAKDLGSDVLDTVSFGLL